MLATPNVKDDKMRNPVLCLRAKSARVFLAAHTAQIIAAMSTKKPRLMSKFSMRKLMWDADS
jgi:hypothetical protein